MFEEILIDLIKIGGPSAVALIVLYLIVTKFLWIVNKFLETLNNHIQHNTKVLTEVSERTQADTSATRENTKVLQELKETLIKLNGK